MTKFEDKFYVQSGNLKELVLADTPVNAIIKAIRRNEHDVTIGTSDVFTVSQKGFVLDREDFMLDTTEVVTLDEVLGAMNED
jgi:hypothetical protein